MNAVAIKVATTGVIAMACTMSHSTYCLVGSEELS